MPKDDLVYLGHMLDLAEKITAKVKGISRTQFDADENLRLALAHLVQTFGESARHISLPFQQSHANIPWSAIIGMRHKVVHDYLHVDFDIVWGVATQDLPSLIVELRKIALIEEA
ncbi:MAG TPA: HepT-like ribonuclease domain-containing protein [Thermoguttaceae bacterium]